MSSSAPDKARRMEQWRASRHLNAPSPQASNPFRDGTTKDDSTAIMAAASLGTPVTRPGTPPREGSTPVSPYELFHVEPPVELGRMPWDSDRHGYLTDAATPASTTSSSSSSEESAEMKPRGGWRSRGAGPRPPPSPAPPLLFDDIGVGTHAAPSSNNTIHAPSTSGRVRVAVRIRPPTTQELYGADSEDSADLLNRTGPPNAAASDNSSNRPAGYRPACEPAPEQSRVLVRRRADSWDADAMNFDAVFGDAASQRRVYEEVAGPVVESVLNGYNGTVMAYGQTGTGKTFTMSGPSRVNESHKVASNTVCSYVDNPFVSPSSSNGGTTNRVGVAGEDRGVVARALERILGVCARDGADSSVTVQYVQVYLDAAYDLLAGRGDAAKPLDVREDVSTGEVFAAGAKSVEVTSVTHAMRVLREGERNRACANHLLNAASSRSHALLSITVRRKVGGDSSIDRQTTPIAKNNQMHNQNYQNKPDNRVRVLKGKLLLVDLAGCERVGKSGAEGTTFDEAIAINLHLHALGKCIAALALNGADNANSTNANPKQIQTNDGSSNSPTHVHVPYRESKLTRLLKDSLGGTAMTSLIVTVAPGAEHLSETLAALTFGSRALKVTNSLKVKQEVDYRLSARKLQDEVDTLTVRLERCEAELLAKSLSLKAKSQVNSSNEIIPPNTPGRARAVEAVTNAGRILTSDSGVQHDSPTPTYEPIKLSVNVDADALDFVDREIFTNLERELAGVKALLNQREDELVQLCVAKEASDATSDALRGELEVAADNAILHAQAVEKKYVEERLELQRTWDEEEDARIARETKWRAEIETYKRERDELVDAAVAERNRWDAEMAAERTHVIAERAQWEVERAALVSAAEAAASKSEAASARAADALAKVASHNAWETERSNLLAELDADRAAFATAQTAEIAKIRQTHDAEIGSLRDALNTSERALESNAKRHRDELTAVESACESSRRESLSRMETECIERVAAAEAETARLRASLADVVSQSEACVNDAVASAYAAWRADELEPAIGKHASDVDVLERKLEHAEAQSSRHKLAAIDAADERETWCIEVAVLRAKWQMERDARVAEGASHRKAWAEEQARLQRRFDDEILNLNDELRLRLGYTDAEAAVGLKAYAVGSDNKPRFKRRPFPVTAEAAQSATARRDAVLSLFEGQSLGQIVSMVRNNSDGADQNYSAEDVRMHACKILANLAAIDEHNAVRVVQEGGLRAILSVFGGFNSLSNSEATRRVAAGALANLAMAEANQAHILNGGAVEMLGTFARDSTDPASARMIAGAVANLCGNETTESLLHDCGGLALIARLADKWADKSPEVRTQVARALANYTKCDGGKMRVATYPGALGLSYRLSTEKEDTGARRHARIALCEVATDLDVGAGAVRDVPGAMELLTTLAGSGGLNDEELTSDEGSRDERRERKAARKALRRIEQSLPPDHRYSDRL